MRRFKFPSASGESPSQVCRAAFVSCVTVLCVLAVAGVGVGQSGRRKQPPLSPVPPPSSEKPAPSTTEGVSDSDARTKAKTDKASTALYSFTVFEDDSPQSFVSIPMGTARLVVNSFVRRLEEAGNLSVSAGGRSDRRRAHDHAKTEKEAYTVLLQLDVETPGGRAGSQTDLNDLTVRYYVYTPVTATLKASGQVYLRPYQSSTRVGGVRLPIPSTTRRVPIEYIFEQAGSDAAERVMSSFNVRLPDRR